MTDRRAYRRAGPFLRRYYALKYRAFARERRPRDTRRGLIMLQVDALAFTDLQANIAAELIKRGYPVMVFNQRSVPEILQMIRTLGALIGRGTDADRLASRLELEIDAIREASSRLPIRPRVFFEEWNDPIISGIIGVEDLVELAGG